MTAPVLELDENPPLSQLIDDGRQHGSTEGDSDQPRFAEHGPRGGLHA